MTVARHGGMTLVGREIEFEWKHELDKDPVVSTIVSMRVYDNNELSRSSVDIAVVYSILYPSPFVFIHDGHLLEFMAAIVREIRRENKRLIEANKSLVTGVVLESDIEGHKWKSLRAKDYMEDK